MSKAFLKEPEAADPTCPTPVGCGNRGIVVARATLQVMLPAECVGLLAEPAYACENSRCEVGYFDSWGASVPADLRARRAWPKDPDAPLCACTGLTVADLESDAQRKDPSRVRELLSRAKTCSAECLVRSPTGHPCADAARRVYSRASGLPGAG